MEKFSVENDFKNEIDELWRFNDFQSVPFIERGYAVQNEIIKHSLLFVGINPSFSGKLEHKSHFYNNEQNGKIYSYFKKFQDISNKLNIPWSHIDLLYLRETNQKSIVDIFSTEIGKIFIYKQLEISKKIIEKVQPRVIIVSNSFARHLLNIDFRFEFDDKIGTHKVIEHPTLNNVPVFFTSMLTGQRALDLGSYERLVWHIRQVI
jgi:hypothetical protein